ncbi:GNAT family N-acetyltransferase [Nioella aestuarii]|uniref:GNAT family N-acetyltransferase n=1 Tax=Nioella aestuarii TaxID=1662864 RepID=UPI003D7F2678
MDRLRIRPAREEDREALTHLLAASYPALLASDYAPDLLARALPLIARANPALLASGSYYLMKPALGGAPLAAGGWTADSPHQPEAAGIGHVRHVVTHPMATRRGLAARLIGRSFTEAKIAGLTQLVALSTLMAVPFYAAMGFAAEREEIIVMAPGVHFPAVRMVRAL